eukprot:2431796-Pyramimonas_sp.AAC.1
MATCVGAAVGAGCTPLVVPVAVTGEPWCSCAAAPPRLSRGRSSVPPLSIWFRCSRVAPWSSLP